MTRATKFRSLKVGETFVMERNASVLWRKSTQLAARSVCFLSQHLRNSNATLNTEGLRPMKTGARVWRMAEPQQAKKFDHVGG